MQLEERFEAGGTGEDDAVMPETLWDDDDSAGKSKKVGYKQLYYERVGLQQELTDEQEDQLEAIQLAVHLMSPRERQVIELLAYEDLTEKQAAGRLGISQQMVSKLLKRAQQKVHKVYGSRKSDFSY